MGSLNKCCMLQVFLWAHVDMSDMWVTSIINLGICKLLEKKTLIV